MIATLLPLVLGGAGGFGGAELVQNLAGLTAGNLNGGLVGAISGVLGGGIGGKLLGGNKLAQAAGDAVSSGGFNLKQVIGGLAGGAGAGAIVQAVLGMVM